MFAVRHALFGGLCALFASVPGPLVQAADIDGDGVDDSADVCCNTPAGLAVDDQGRPLADLDGDCDGDLEDFALFMAGFSGPDTCGPEECDGLDNDCNCLVDDMGFLACGVGECYREVDVCVGGMLQDCLPGDPSPEVCDGLDNDCDGTPDNDPVDAPTWYRDLDDDQYGNPNVSVMACEQPQGYVGVSQDCDDDDPDINPSALEQCDDTKDNDCDGAEDCLDSDCPSGTPCGPPQYVCEAGDCTCQAGYGDCDDSYPNGCETNTNTDLNNCGECAFACILPHAVPACQVGTCQIVSCLSGWGNCDGSVPNGCETDTNSSLTHCGACGTPCALPHATEVCQAGMCQISACDNAWANCDIVQSDGCEFNLNDGGGSCPSGEQLSSIPGDDGCTTGPWGEGHGEKWYRIYVTEESSNPLITEDLSIRVTLQSPSQLDYDLYVYDPCGTLRGSSELGIGALDQVVYTWNDSMVYDDSRWIYIEVRFYRGNACDNWTLRTYGDCP